MIAVLILSSTISISESLQLKILFYLYTDTWILPFKLKINCWRPPISCESVRLFFHPKPVHKEYTGFFSSIINIDRSLPKSVKICQAVGNSKAEPLSSKCSVQHLTQGKVSPSDCQIGPHLLLLTGNPVITQHYNWFPLTFFFSRI